MANLLDTLVSQVVVIPQGLAFREIQAHLQPQEAASVPDRTLRRRLAVLVRDGRIRRVGISRYVRYFPPHARDRDPVYTGIPSVRRATPFVTRCGNR